jgi:hypothetical protein
MGIVGIVVEAVFALPIYLWTLFRSGWTSLSLLYEFLHLIASGESAAAAAKGSGWFRWWARLAPSMERLTSSYPHYLMVAGTVLMHYVVNSMLTGMRFSRRPDRVVWAGFSTGIVLGWMYVFRETLPGGRLGVYTLNDAQKILVMSYSQSLITFLIPYYLYVLLTGVTSGSRPGGFFTRKFIPTLAALVYTVSLPAVATHASLLSTMRVSGWLLRVLAADAITDVIVAWNERMTAVCLVVWTAAIGSAFNEYALYLNDALGLFPCLALTGMALWSYIAQIKAERR